MSDINGPFKILVEDYTGVSTTVVLPDGQKRWYDNVTGYQTSEIIEVVGDGSTQLGSLPKRQPLTDGAQTIYGNKTFDDPAEFDGTATFTSSVAFQGDYDIEDTSSGDVAATTPTSPVNGQIWTVVNSGSSGNHVTGLPGSISLGDGKTITFTYDSTNTTWRYEDVIIDEYTSGSETVRKWSGGRMENCGSLTASGSSTSTHTFVEAFNAAPLVAVGPRNQNVAEFANMFPTSTQLQYSAWNNSGARAPTPLHYIAIGRWKA